LAERVAQERFPGAVSALLVSLGAVVASGAK
jgi:hypothetical protein